MWEQVFFFGAIFVGWFVYDLVNAKYCDHLEYNDWCDVCDWNASWFRLDNAILGLVWVGVIGLFLLTPHHMSPIAVLLLLLLFL